MSIWLNSPLQRRLKTSQMWLAECVAYWLSSAKPLEIRHKLIKEVIYQVWACCSAELQGPRAGAGPCPSSARLMAPPTKGQIKVSDIDSKKRERENNSNGNNNNNLWSPTCWHRGTSCSIRLRRGRQSPLRPRQRWQAQSSCRSSQTLSVLRRSSEARTRPRSRASTNPHSSSTISRSSTCHRRA